MRTAAHIAALALVVLVCGCKSPSEATPSAPSQGTAQAESPRKPVTDLEQVDLSSFDDDSKSMWAELVNELLSPCGEPISVGRCVADKRDCKRCVGAVRYVARLVDEGMLRDEIRDLYRLRYDDRTRVKLTYKGAPNRGAKDAPITIYEFSDFQCPHCRTAAPQLKKLVESQKGKVRLVFKHFPLSGHPRARDAAIAAVAAHNQGKFWPMHDLLFDNPDRLEPADISRYAKSIGLNMSRFKADIANKRTAARVDADRKEGSKAGVNGTPAIFVNGRSYTLSVDALPAYLTEE